MFAVIRTGGKQYRVAAEDVIKVDKVKGSPGEIVQFGDVLVVGGDSVTLGQPTIAGASVAAEVLEQGRGPKIIAFKKRRRKNSRRKRGKADQDRKAQARAKARRRGAGRARGGRTCRDQGAQAQGRHQNASQGSEETVQNPGEKSRQAEIGRQGQEEVMISSQSWIT